MKSPLKPLVLAVTLALAGLSVAQTTAPSTAEQNPLARNQNPLAGGSNPLGSGGVGQQPAQPGAQQLLPWQKVGVRLSYYMSDSVSPGAGTTLTPQANGKWTDPQTGKTYGEKELRGSGGVAIISCDIVGIEGDSMGVAVTGYLATGAQLDNLVPAPSVNLGRYCKLSGDDDVFRRPEDLAAMQDGITGDGGIEIRVARTRMTLSGREFNAISIATQIPGGWTNRIYDLESGILLVRSTMAAGEVTTQVDPRTGQVTQGGRGKTSSYCQFLGIRDLNLGQPVNVTPTLRQGTQITINGQSIMPGPMGELRSPYAAQLRVESVGQQSVLVSSKYLQEASMNLWADGNSLLISNNSLLGAAINPGRYANLQPGATIDRDEFTRTTLTFAGAQNGMVFLTERGQTWEITRGYDARTGLLVLHRKTLAQQGVGNVGEEAQVTYQ
jgi:hypothetical protein